MNNKTFRLFVSSTFMDFIEERNLLNDCVLPNLSAFCRRHGYYFQLIDLRWGIYTEAALNQRTLSICLGEVSRCQQNAPRPNFLAMVGERYGWVPLPPFVDKAEMERILSTLSDKSSLLVKEWYLYDDNETDGRYYLKERTGRFVNEAAWGAVENTLHAILLSGAQAAGLTDRELLKYTASATEHETMLGLLSSEEALRSSVVVFRDNHPEKDTDLRPINDLKARIRREMDGANCSDKMVTLDYADADYRRRFVEEVKEHLLSAIEAEMARLRGLPPETDLERLRHYYRPDMPYVADEEAARTLRANLACGRQIDEDEYVGGRVVFVTGESGSGKTTFLSKFIQDNSDLSYSFVFYGENENAFDMASALRSIVRQIAKRYGLSGFSAINPANMDEQFAHAIWSVPAEEHHVVVIDGLDMFAGSDTHGQNVLPFRLPHNVDIVVSSADPAFTRRVAHKNAYFVQLGSIDRAHGMACLDQYLARHHRRIANTRQRRALECVLSTNCTPLHIKLLSDIACAWASDVDSVEAPATAIEAAEHYMARPYLSGEHDRDFVLYAMSLLSMSTIGLSERDLLDILYCIPSVRAKFSTESKHSFAMTHMPFAVWSRLYYDLYSCLNMAIYQGESIVQFSHAVFSRAIRTYHADVCRDAARYLTAYCAEHEERYRLSHIRLSLLLDAGDYTGLAAILSGVDFVDRYVQAGGLSHVIEVMAEVVAHTDATVHAAVKRNLFCLYRHSDALQSYPYLFSTFAYEMGRTERTPLLYRQAGGTVASQELPAPYGSDAHVVWNADASRYVVYTQHQIHVCDGNTGTELSNISLSAMLGGRQTIREVKWARERILLASEDAEVVYVCGFHDGLPVLIGEIKADCFYDILGYDAAQDVVVTREYDCVYFTSLATMETTSLALPLPAKSSVCYDEKAHQLVVYVAAKPHYEIYAVANGAAEYRHSVYVKRGNRPDPQHTLHAVEGGGYLHLPDFYEINYILWQPDAQRHVYFYPPAANRILRTLLGKRYAIYVYKEGVMAVDLASMSTAFYAQDDVTDVAWYIEDKRLSVLTRYGAFYRVSIDAFVEAEPMMTSRYNLSSRSAKGILNALVAIGMDTREAHRQHVFLSYGDVFAFGLESDKVKLLDKMVPTLVVRSDSGRKAVAYEYCDTLVVLDRDDEPLFVIDHLQLGMNNNLLKVVFSSCGRFLAVWTNRFLQVFHLDRCACVLALSVMRPYRPIFDLWFTEKELHVSFFEGEDAVYLLTHGGLAVMHKPPRHTQDGASEDPYYTLPTTRDTFYTLFNLEDATYYSTRAYKKQTGSVVAEWIIKTRHYHSEHYVISFYGGTFFLAMDAKQPFRPDCDCDLENCLERQLDAYESEIALYVAWKNDIFSSLYELEDGHAVLVCRMLNAVLLFNVTERRLLAAYPVEGKILGCYRKGPHTVTVYVDALDNPVDITVALPSDGFEV